jgi:NADP-dependent 3-hydroxy acid dehydrogenase YdfG/acyl carrier protein
MRLVDVRSDASAAEVAELLAAEAASTSAEPLAAWRAGRRWLRRYEPVVLPSVDAARLPLRQRGVYLVTGGLGGIGLAVAVDLARRVSARLVLTTRGTPELPAALQANAADVLVLQADAADETAMRAVVDRAFGAFGGVDGVIHAAGIAGEGRLAVLKSAADVEAVLAPKGVGLDVLGRVLGACPLDFVVLMGSINAVVPAPGVADYAAANAVLDAFVDSSTRPTAWRQVLAIDWSAWREVGMAAKLVVPSAQQAAWRANLAGGIPTQEGVEALWRALASGRRRLVVTPHALPSPAAAAAEVASTEPAAAPIVARGATRGEPPADEIERHLAAIWFTLLGVEHIGRNDDFFDLGGHSLMATRVMARVADTLGAKLTMRDVFEAPRLRDLASKITQQIKNDDREEIEF